MRIIRGQMEIQRRLQKRWGERLGADIERLEPSTPYSGSYQEVVDQGQREVEAGYCPPLKPLAHDPKNYDAIVAGTPTWWYTMAPVMHSFLKKVDWNGKVFVPFMTNAGWPGTVIKDMEECASGARVILAKEIRFDSKGGDHLVTKKSEVENWMKKVQKELQ